jgi:hypothetical protein
MNRKDVNKEFDNKFEDMKTLLGFTPAIFKEKKENKK